VGSFSSQTRQNLTSPLVESDHVKTACAGPSLSIAVPRFHFPSPLSLPLFPHKLDDADGAACAHIRRAMSTPKIGEERKKEELNFFELDFGFYVSDFWLHTQC
jgi:hypothetical protein